MILWDNDQSMGQQLSESRCKLLNIGSPGRTRTADKVVNSHPLYQLSYRGRCLYSSTKSRCPCSHQRQCGEIVGTHRVCCFDQVTNLGSTVVRRNPP